MCPNEYLKRAKRPVNDDSQDNCSQQKGKYQLIGIKPFQNNNLIAGLFYQIKPGPMGPSKIPHCGSQRQTAMPNRLTHVTSCELRVMK